MTILNLNQSSDELNKVYEDNYYWYLKSHEFRQTFLSVLGMKINTLRGTVLDVGCGEGWLATYTYMPYTGIDGSQRAIEKARKVHPNSQFFLDRLESPSIPGKYSTIVFGGIFFVLIKPDKQAELLDRYKRQYGMKHFIIYDLETLDTSNIDASYQQLSEYHGRAVVEGLEEIKQSRKILVYDAR